MKLKVSAATVALFGFAGLAYAQLSTKSFQCKPGGEESPIQSLRNFFWMATGFPGSQEYSCFHDNDANIQALVGQDGLIGRINGIRESVVAAIIADGTITTCMDVPTTGTLQMSATETLAFGTATRTPPAGFPHSAAYDKKVSYTDSSNNRVAEFEFHCSRASMMVKLTDTLAGGPQTVAVFFDGEQTSTNSSKYVSFFMRDQGNFNTELNIAMSLIVNADQTYKIWLSRAGLDNTDFSAYRFTGTGDAATQKLSVHYHDVSNDHLDNTNYANAPDIDDDGVVGAVAPDSAGSQPTQQAQGCATSYNVLTRDISSTALCAGLTPTAHPRDTLAPGSRMSMLWMQDSFPAWLNAL